MCTNVFIYDYHHQEQASEADYHIIFWGYEYLHRIYSCVIITIMMMRGHTHTFSICPGKYDSSTKQNV